MLGKLNTWGVFNSITGETPTHNMLHSMRYTLPLKETTDIKQDIQETKILSTSGKSRNQEIDRLQWTNMQNLLFQ
jgi:hypothetical protein